MRIFKAVCLAAVLGAMAFTAPHVSAQISLTTVVDLALRNSPKIKMAQADVNKARASLSEAHDAYVPAVSTSGGYGASTGVPLSLPVVFNISAQSLVFNFSQKDYVRAAASGVTAATFALNEARIAVAEDAVTTYVSLNNAQQRRAALEQSGDFAGRLVQIVQERFDAGMEPRRQVLEANRTATQLRLQRLQVDDEVASLADHMARITGVRDPKITTVAESIPEFVPPSETASSPVESEGLKAADANVVARQFVAHGDARYRLRPQVAFSAGYSRISTYGTNYILYYPGFDPERHPDISYNSFDIGIQITVPIFDLVHQAKARGAAADAAHSVFDVQTQRLQFEEGRLKLRHAAAELTARSELASLDQQLAQDQLETIQIQLKAVGGSPDAQQLTPKDEQNAHLQERQRFVDYLDAQLQLRQAEISLMRQTGQLGDWLHVAIAAAPGVPTTVPTVLPPGAAAPQQIP